MNLMMRKALAKHYKSQSQAARVVTEAWASEQLYCVSCSSRSLSRAKPNRKAIDLICGRCDNVYQLKSSRRWGGRKIPDAGYDAMMESIWSDQTPHLLVMQYTAEWYVQNLLVVPSFFFTESMIEKRRPLSATARRAGWVGCNILLGSVANEGKIAIVDNGISEPPRRVRTRFATLASLQELDVPARGWALNVLAAVREIGASEFTLAEVYEYEPRLQRIYPNNRNIRAKIRQQLQVLRDMGRLVFLGRGRYRLLV